ncbi:SA1362 family protein [Bacillus horti]|uniref:Uncharacterized protein n=1 Tax=Caldalkalibacillus horti TaxID=77523 RepID=A0ABT9W1D0_9BACI|nr:SA1362 family protein [Bacillus horti]MDQ0166894.1 hypothetical protein [Bacillus horti]
MRKLKHPVIYVFLGLAAFGFLWQLLTQPQQLLSTILSIGLIVLIGFGIYHFLIRKGKLGHTQKSFSNYRRYPVSKDATARDYYSAASSAKTKSVQKKAKTRSKSSKARNHSFTVIEGKKGKRKL